MSSRGDRRAKQSGRLFPPRRRRDPAERRPCQLLPGERNTSTSHERPGDEQSWDEHAGDRVINMEGFGSDEIFKKLLFGN